MKRGVSLRRCRVGGVLTVDDLLDPEQDARRSREAALSDLAVGGALELTGVVPTVTLRFSGLARQPAKSPSWPPMWPIDLKRR